MKLSRAAAAAAASALLTLTGCGSSSSLATDDAAAASAPESSDATEEPTDDEPTVDDPELTAGPPPDLVVLDEESFLPTVVEAQLVAATTQMDLTMDVGGQSITMTGQLRAAETVEASAMQFEMELPGMGGFEMILVDNVLYMNAGPATEDKFAKLRLDDPVTEQFLGQLKSQLSPAETTKALEGAMTAFEAAGTDTVDGQETTKYILVVDTAKVLDRGGVTEVPGYELPESLEYTFWLNEEQLPVKISVDMGELGVVDMSFTGWGEPVEIQAPPPSQITEQNPFAPPQA